MARDYEYNIILPPPEFRDEPAQELHKSVKEMVRDYEAIPPPRTRRTPPPPRDRPTQKPGIKPPPLVPPRAKRTPPPVLPRTRIKKNTQTFEGLY